MTPLIIAEDRATRAFAWLAMTGLMFACTGPSRAEIDRSMREFQLAATLREEGSMPSAVEHLQKALELDPKNARAHLLQGYIQMERRDYRMAEGSLRRGIELLLEQDERGAVIAEARNLLGLALIHLHRYEDASKVLRSAASDVMNTQPHFAWGNLGLAYHKQGKHDKALEALEEAVRREPRFCVGHYRIGQALFAKGQFEPAEEALTKALEADARCGRVFQEAWRLRGEARARLGYRQDAIADFERCIELGTSTEEGETCQRMLEDAH